MIPFGGAYTRKQWGRGIRLAMHPTGRSLVLRLIIMVLVLAGLGFVAFSLFQGDDINEVRALRLSVGLAILAYWALSPYYRAWRAANQPWRAGGGGVSLKGSVSGEGIASNASVGGTVEKWETFLRTYGRDDMVVLVGADGLATILPRDFFATEDHWQGFLQFVEFNVVTPE